MMRIKQPHEDVQGVDRDDLLLSLDEGALPHRMMLMGLAVHLHSAVLVGNPAPSVKRIYERISQPQVGDLVVEWMMWRRTDEPHRAMGVLLEVRDEWWTTDEQWERDKAEDSYLVEADRPTDRAWYIQYGPNAADVYRWTNCMFIAVPAPDETFQLPAGRRDGDGTVFTRNSLLGALADSGFALKSPSPGE